MLASQGPLEVRERIAVTSGESVRRLLPLGASRLILAMRGPSGEALGTDGSRVWYRIERLDVAGTEPLHSFDTNAIIDVPPGRYRIVGHTTSTAVKGTADVDIGNGETRAVVLKPAAGVLVLRPGARLPGDVTWHITDGAGHRVWVNGPGDRHIALAAGEYTVRATALGIEPGRQIEIRVGQRSEVTLGE